ncbi:MAG: universal stress protein [Desulfobacteraceae bacterium]|jgi:nucleotide-binding universal stress UspA family protein
MEKPKRILAACDDSPQAAYVATYAASLASVMAPHLVLARIIPRRDVEAVRQAFAHFPDAPKDPNEAVSEYVREEKKNGHKELSHLLGRRYRGLKVETVVRDGVPHEVLLDLVAEKQIDIMVVGASKHNILLDRIIGSTVSHLFRHCPVPLVSARQAGAFAMAHQVDRATCGVYILNQPEASLLMDCDFRPFQ